VKKRLRPFDPDFSKQRKSWVLKEGDVFRGAAVFSADLPSMASQVGILEGSTGHLLENDKLTIYYIGEPAWVAEFDSAKG
tara:strand:+ start:8455 stop:8694 length:240 start_codon:yes stop_codon:yes gene_type:complete